MNKLFISCDPQPTLSAFGIRKPNGSVILIKSPLCLKNGKNKYVNNLLNKKPQKMDQHLHSIFDEELTTDLNNYDILFMIECQTKSKCTIALEAFIKGWMIQHFDNINIVSVSARGWQPIIPKEFRGVDKKRKDYENQSWELICNEEDLELVTHIRDLDDKVVNDGEYFNRQHDLIDCYWMLKYMNKKF
jgi:hypothetical protein